LRQAFLAFFDLLGHLVESRAQLSDLGRSAGRRRDAEVSFAERICRGIQALNRIDDFALHQDRRDHRANKRQKTEERVTRELNAHRLVQRRARNAHRNNEVCWSNPTQAIHATNVVVRALQLRDRDTLRTERIEQRRTPDVYRQGSISSLLTKEQLSLSIEHGDHRTARRLDLTKQRIDSSAVEAQNHGAAGLNRRRNGDDGS